MRKLFWWLVTLTWASLIFYLTSIPNFKVTDDSLLSFLISNGGHFIFFGIQAILLSATLSQYSILNSFASVLPVSLYGALDELHQLSVPGRSADLTDWLLDTLGALTFLIILKKLQSKL